jgi:adenylate kinase
MLTTRILSHRLAVRSFATASVSNEVKDASLIFSAAFDALEARVGRDALQFPKECIWLGGAPGSGNGTNTDFILRERDIDAPAVVTSSLLNSPAAKAVKAAGGMVGDPIDDGLKFDHNRRYLHSVTHYLHGERRH